MANVNFNEVTKPIASGLSLAGMAAAALIADPTFLAAVPPWLKVILVGIVAVAGFAGVYFTPQAATGAQISKAGADAAAVITKVVVPQVAQATKDSIQGEVGKVVNQLPQPIQDLTEPVIAQSGELVDQLIGKFRGTP